MRGSARIRGIHRLRPVTGAVFLQQNGLFLPFIGHNDTEAPGLVGADSDHAPALRRHAVHFFRGPAYCISFNPVLKHLFVLLGPFCVYRRWGTSIHYGQGSRKYRITLANYKGIFSQARQKDCVFLFPAPKRQPGTPGKKASAEGNFVSSCSVRLDAGKTNPYWKGWQHL